jgi:hypothetical protein
VFVVDVESLDDWIEMEGEMEGGKGETKGLPVDRLAVLGRRFREIRDGTRDIIVGVSLCKVFLYDVEVGGPGSTCGGRKE